MKAFLLSIVLLLVVALGAAFVVYPIWDEPAATTYATDNVRLGEAADTSE